MGSECGAVCDSLNWADDNLFAGYEYMLIERTSATDALYFVSGILNSSQTLSNDPFTVAVKSFQFGACWNAEYAVGLNPF